MFACHAPYDDPKYVIACVVEHGGGGSSVAAPIGAQVMAAALSSTNASDGEVRDIAGSSGKSQAGAGKGTSMDVRLTLRGAMAVTAGNRPAPPPHRGGHSLYLKPRCFPWLHLPLAIVITLLVGYGLIIVYSAVRADGDYQYSRQLGGVAVGLVFMMILVWRFDYRRLSDYTTLFLIINVVLIMSPHIPGLGTDAGMGARSWIKLGMQIQPGEFAKITVILMDAAVMARYGGNLDDPREYVAGLLGHDGATCVHHDAARPGYRPGVSVHCGVRPGHGRR